VGSGIGINLLTNGYVPIWVGCVITGLDTFTFLAVHYLGVRYLEVSADDKRPLCQLSSKRLEDNWNSSSG